MKSFTLGGAQDFQTSLAPVMDAAPRWRALYAERAEYRPSPNEGICKGLCADTLKTFPEYVKLLQSPLSPRSDDVLDPVMVGKCVSHRA